MNAITSLRLLALALSASVAAFAAERFQVKVTGHGQPMLLIPGLSCSGEVWNDTVTHLQDRYECHVVTLAGFAGVPSAGGNAFIEPTREALASYIETNKLNHPVIMGHSLGGYVAADLAAHHPDLAGPVVIVDSYPFLSGVGMPGVTLEMAQARASQMRQQMDSLPDEFYRQGVTSGQFTRKLVTSDSDHARVVAWSLATDRGTASLAMSELLGSDLRPALANIQTPVLVLLSAESLAPYIPAAQVESIGREQYAKVTALKIAVSEKARHFIMCDDPVWLYAQIDGFLSR